MRKSIGALSALALLASAGGVAAQQQQQGGTPPKVDCPAGQQRIGTGVCATITGPGAAGGAAAAMTGPTSGAAGTVPSYPAAKTDGKSGSGSSKN